MESIFDSNDKEYEVEKIITRKYYKNKKYYLIKFKYKKFRFNAQRI